MGGFHFLGGLSDIRFHPLLLLRSKVQLLVETLANEHLDLIHASDAQRLWRGGNRGFYHKADDAAKNQQRHRVNNGFGPVRTVHGSTPMVMAESATISALERWLKSWYPHARLATARMPAQIAKRRNHITRKSPLSLRDEARQCASTRVSNPNGGGRRGGGRGGAARCG